MCINLNRNWWAIVILLTNKIKWHTSVKQKVGQKVTRNTFFPFPNFKSFKGLIQKQTLKKKILKYRFKVLRGLIHSHKSQQTTKSKLFLQNFFMIFSLSTLLLLWTILILIPLHYPLHLVYSKPNILP